MIYKLNIFDAIKNYTKINSIKRKEERKINNYQNKKENIQDDKKGNIIDIQV